MGFLPRWIVNLVVIYGLLVGIGLMARRALIYPFDNTAAWTGDLPGVLIKRIERDDAPNMVTWAAEPEAGQPVVFYFMGNVGNLAHFSPRIRVERVLRIRVPPERRIIYGISLGTGIAADLAVSRSSAGVIFEAPYTRLCEAAEYQLKIVPACRLMWDEAYPIVDQVIDINAPILVLHGTEDTTIPVEMGKRVAERGNDVTLKLFEGAEHNNLRQFGSGKEIKAFIDAIIDKP